MAFAYTLPLRAVQGVLALIILGLVAYIINAYDGPYDYGFSPDCVNYYLFCSIWTLLALAYLILAPLYFARLAHKFAVLAVETLTMIFWFAGWIAMAAFWGDIRCGSKGGPCGAGTAAIVFGVVEWLTFLATTVMAALYIRDTGRHNSKHDPAMEVHAGV